MNLQFPETFDGRFYFTNFSEDEFSTKWNGVTYTFPPLKTVPLIITSESAQNIQNIRKKFARDLAEREFYKSNKFKSLNNQVPVGEGQSLHASVTYTEGDLTEYIQKCLDPLPMETIRVFEEPRKEVELRTDDKGKKVSKIVEENDSLIGEGQVVA